MFSQYYEDFSLLDEEQSMVFEPEDENTDTGAAMGSPNAEARDDALVLEELQRSLKAIRKAASLATGLKLTPETLAALDNSQILIQDLCLKITAELGVPGVSSSSTPEPEVHSTTPPPLFPDYSAVFRPKVLPVEAPKPAQPAKKSRRETPVQSAPSKPSELAPSTALSFTTLTFMDDGRVSASFHGSEETMAPPPGRPKGKKSKTPYSENLKSWRSQPYGPRQLASAPNDLMMEFVMPNQTEPNPNNGELFLGPLSAHQYNRQLN